MPIYISNNLIHVLLIGLDVKCSVCAHSETIDQHLKAVKAHSLEVDTLM